MIGTEVQKAIHDALKAAPAVSGGRIYDSVPEKPHYPYVTIGNEQVIDDSNSCSAGWQVFADIHIWSRAVGLVEAKTLAAQVGDRLIGIAALPGFNLLSVEFEDQRALRDRDGQTSHIVATFKFLIDQA